MALTEYLRACRRWVDGSISMEYLRLRACVRKRDYRVERSRLTLFRYSSCSKIARDSSWHRYLPAYRRSFRYFEAMPRRRRRVVHTERFAAIKSLRSAFVHAVAALHNSSSHSVRLLDVGANAGDFVEGVMADLAKAKAAARVRPIMWEPQASFAPALQALARRWSGDLVAAAASTQSGSQTIYLHGERCGGGTTCFNPESASLVPTPGTDAAAVKAGIKTTIPRFNVSSRAGVVPTVDFAKYLQQNLSLAMTRAGRIVPPVPALVKLDVEG